MKLKEIRTLDADGARFACMANDYCTPPPAATNTPRS